MSIDGVGEGPGNVVRALQLASMGPSMSIDGVDRVEVDSLAMHGASMGPSMSIDGVGSIIPTATTRHRSFNGAVDEHRRSPPTWEEAFAVADGLQWGRR